VAAGAGVAPHEVNQLVKQFESARDMMRVVGGMGAGNRMRLMKSLMGGGLGAMAANAGGGPILRTKKSGFTEKKDRNKKKRR
jgi:hypothetical protein